MPTAEETAAAQAAATATSVQTPTADPPPPPAKAAADEAIDPSWLKTRLDRERAKALKDAGFANADDAKAAADAVKKAADANKSAEARALEAENQVKTARAELEPLKQAIAERATSELDALASDAQREMVKSLAGDDPAKQLTTIASLRKGGAFAPPVDPKTGKPPIPPPANTSAAGAAPPPANAGAPNHKATLEALEKTNPMAAAHYALRNQGEIYKGDGS